MAKIYNFHIYSHEDNQDTDVSEFENAKISIANELGYPVGKELEKIFENDDIVIANEIEPPGEKGGGSLGIFPLADLLYVGLIISVTLVTKGFFDELGRELAKKLLNSLFDKEKPTKLIVLYKNKRFEVIIPSKSKLNHTESIELFLKDLDINKSGKYIFSSEKDTLILIEEHSDCRG